MTELFIVTLFVEPIGWAHHKKCQLEELQAGIKIGDRNINNLRYAYDTTPMAESEEELKSLLMVCEGQWKSQLKAKN